MRVNAPDFATETACKGSGYNASLLHSGCPLLARKFPKNLVSEIARMFGECGFEMKVVDVHAGNAVCEVQGSSQPEEVEWKVDI